MTEPNELKRGRGRPKGASCLNEPDSLTLSKIADIIAANPMPPTTAMRRLGIHGEAATRRLQRKWKKDGERYLEAAQERRRKPAAPSRRTRRMSGYVPPSLMAGLYDYVNSPGISSAFEQARMMAENLHAQRALDLALGMAERPFEKLVREAEERDRQLQQMKAMMEMPTLQERMEQMEQMQRATQLHMEMFGSRIR